MPRSARLVLATTVLALAGAAPAAAAWTPIGTVGPAAGQARVLAPAPDGGAYVISATDAVYAGPGDLTVDLVRPGRPATRWTGRRKLLLDHAPGADGTLDLLVQEGGSPASATPPDLSLLRLERSGAVRRIWRGRRAAGQAALARTGSWVAVAWLERRAGTRSVALRLAAGRGRVLGRPRTVRRVLPAFLQTAEPSFVSDLDVGLDRAGRPTFALTAWSRASEVLVLATTSARGALRDRQVTRGPQGLVDVQVTPGGRTAVLVEDTGIEGEEGECVSDGDPRRVWAALREPGARRFAPTQLVDELPFVCAAARARLLTGARNRVRLVWGTADEGREPAPPAIRVALAAPGGSFRRAAPLPAAQLQAAALDAAGGLALLATSPAAASPEAPLGPLVLQRRTPHAEPVSTEILEPAGNFGALAAIGGDGRLLVSWAAAPGERRTVAVETDAGPR
jgi:hypothetical protein